jgi:hypothetical protein
MIGRNATLAITLFGVSATVSPSLTIARPGSSGTPAAACRSVSSPSPRSLMLTTATGLSSGRTAAICRAARRAEIRGGSRRTNGLSHRPQRHRRHDRNGRRPRARQPRPRASCLAGLTCHRPGRGFRRTVFRAVARHHARRSRHPSLDRSARKGEVIVACPRPARRSVGGSLRHELSRARARRVMAWSFLHIADVALDGARHAELIEAASTHP